jgi:hypothetical protein
MSQALAFPQVYTSDSEPPLLKKLQHAAINQQIKEKLGWRLWKACFKGGSYNVAINRLTIIAPHQKAAYTIANTYRRLLEQLFKATVDMEVHEAFPERRPLA